MTGSSKIISFPPTGAVEWIESYVKEALGKHDESTVEVYQRILRHFTTWVVEVPGHEKRFMPTQLTKPSIELYLSHLRDQGYSVSHRGRVKSVLSGFCQWLMEEKEAIGRNPTRGIKVPTQQILAPRVLEPDQRFVLRTLVDQDEDLRGKAIVALGRLRWMPSQRCGSPAHAAYPHWAEGGVAACRVQRREVSRDRSAGRGAQATSRLLTARRPKP